MVLFEGDGEMECSDGENNYLVGRGKNEGLRKFLFPLTDMGNLSLKDRKSNYVCYWNSSSKVSSLLQNGCREGIHLSSLCIAYAFFWSPKVKWCEHCYLWGVAIDHSRGFPDSLKIQILNMERSTLERSNFLHLKHGFLPSKRFMCYMQGALYPLYM